MGSCCSSGDSAPGEERGLLGGRGQTERGVFAKVRHVDGGEAPAVIPAKSAGGVARKKRAKRSNFRSVFANPPVFPAIDRSADRIAIVSLTPPPFPPIASSSDGGGFLIFSPTRDEPPPDKFEVSLPPHANHGWGVNCTRCRSL